jgi:hypothetical protein
MSNIIMIDLLGRPIEVGDAVKVPKYGDIGTMTGTVVKFHEHHRIVAVKLDKRYRWRMHYNVTDFDMVRWEPEDRI